MKRFSAKDMWRFSQAKDIKLIDRFVLLFLFIAGVVSIFDLAEWWFREEHIVNFPDSFH